jgi:hypothetical protein
VYHKAEALGNSSSIFLTFQSFERRVKTIIMTLLFVISSTFHFSNTIDSEPAGSVGVPSSHEIPKIIFLQHFQLWCPPLKHIVSPAPYSLTGNSSILYLMSA